MSSQSASVQSLVKSNAFVGLKQYRRRIQASLHQSNKCMLVRANAFLGLDQYNQRLEGSSNESTQLKSSSKRKREEAGADSKAKKQKIKMAIEIDDIVYLPLVKSNAFIGESQYQRSVAKMFSDAITITIRTASDGGNWNNKNVQVTMRRKSDGSTAIPAKNRKNLMKRVDDGIRKCKNEKTAIQCLANGVDPTENVIHLPLVKTTAFIGPEEYRRIFRKMYNDAIRLRDNRNRKLRREASKVAIIGTIGTEAAKTIHDGNHEERVKRFLNTAFYVNDEEVEENADCLSEIEKSSEKNIQ